MVVLSVYRSNTKFLFPIKYKILITLSALYACWMVSRLAIPRTIAIIRPRVKRYFLIKFVHHYLLIILRIWCNIKLCPLIVIVVNSTFSFIYGSAIFKKKQVKSIIRIEWFFVTLMVKICRRADGSVNFFPDVKLWKLCEPRYSLETSFTNCKISAKKKTNHSIAPNLII